MNYSLDIAPIFLVFSFVLIILGPLVPALLYLISNTNQSALEVPPNRDDNARHFADGLKTLIEKNFPDAISCKDPIEIDAKNSRITMKDHFIWLKSSDDFPKTPLTGANTSERRIAILNSVAQIPPFTQWYGDAYSNNYLELMENTLLRTLRCDNKLLLHPNVTILRWVDAHSMFVMGNNQLPPRTTASHTLTLSTGVNFSRLYAPQIEIAPPPKTTQTTDTKNPAEKNMLTSKILHDEMFAAPLEHSKWTHITQNDLDQTARHLFKENLCIESHQHITANLICQGDLYINEHVHIEGSIKVYGNLYIAPDVIIKGNVFCGENAQFIKNIKVHGLISCASTLSIGPYCHIGLLNAPTSVCADHISLRSGSIIHGQVFSRNHGQTDE